MELPNERKRQLRGLTLTVALKLFARLILFVACVAPAHRPDVDAQRMLERLAAPSSTAIVDDPQ
jgi:hypothetical protein